MNLFNLVRLFFGAIVPIGWLASFEILISLHFYYFILNLIAFLLTLIFFNIIGNNLSSNIHLWIIFILLKLGYFLTFYILCYMKLNYETFSFYLDVAYPTEISLLNNTQLVINYFETVTSALFVFVFVLMVLRLIDSRPLNQIKNNAYVKKIDFSINFRQKSIGYMLIAVILISTIFLVIQINFGLGLVSGADRQTVELPFRLSGIIMSIINIIIPLVFAGILWVSFISKALKLQNYTIFSFILYGTISGLISTSKEPLYISIIMVAALFLVTNTFTQKRFWQMVCLIPYVALYNSFISINRILRSLYEELGIIEIFNLVIESAVSASFNFDIISNEFSISSLSIFLSPLMRIDGSIPLLQIINHSPLFDLHRFLSIIFGSELPVNSLFTIEVLGVELRDGVAFIPSLLGYFIFLFGNLGFMCICLAIYILIWHIIFRLIYSLRLRLKEVFVALMLINLARFSISGTLESMAQSIAITFVFCLFIEFLFGIILRNRSRKIIRQTL